MTPSFPREFQPAVLRIPCLVACGLTPTGLSPSTAPRSSGLRLHPQALGGDLLHHIHLPLREGVRFGLCRFRSPLLTASRLLSFPAGTQMLPFPAFPLLTERPRRDRISHSGIPGSKAPCASPGLFAAWHALRRRPSPAIHRPGYSPEMPRRSQCVSGNGPLHGLTCPVGINPSPMTFPSSGASAD